MATKAQAQKRAKKLGLKGVHKMPDGGWMAGGTHRAYLNATKKKAGQNKSRKRTSRRKSGY